MREACHLEHRHDVILDAHGAENTRLLWQIAYSGTRPLVYGVLCNVLTVDEYMPFVGHHETSGHIERGGLAGTIGPEQSHNLALVHLERHLVGHGALAITLHQ